MVNDASLKEPLRAPSSTTRDEVDPELLALPRPPSGRRTATMFVMALAVAVALSLVLSVRYDVAYFFASGSAQSLGDATAIAPASLSSNEFVEITGTPMMSELVRYRRVLSQQRYVVFPLAGQRTIFVHMPESALDVPRTSFSGRLVTFGQVGRRLEGVRSFFEETMQTPVTGESYVLFLDESPGTNAWSLLLALGCVAFVLLDVWLLLRWFRPLPEEPDADDGDAPA